MRYFIFVFFLLVGFRASFGDCANGKCARADLLHSAQIYGLGGEESALQKAELYKKEANELREEAESEKDQSKKKKLLEKAEEKEVKALQELAQAKANENSAAQNAHSEHRLNQGQKSGGGGENDMPMQPPQQQQQQKQEKKEEEEESDPRIAQLMKPVPFEIPKQPKEMQNLGNTKSKYISPDLVSPEQLFSKWKSNSM
ncbi:MAG: hypothetical protein EBR01_13490 [Proteobacteria bacterium]|nr:hypothetical protein [Pseudomonadota bacterium]